MGRPTIYTEELGREICSRIASGESLRRICRDDDMPEARTVHYWLLDKKEFFQQYEQARLIQAQILVDELFDIADDGANDWMVRYEEETGETVYKVNGEAVQRSRLRLDTRKWYASKIIPKIYGDKLNVEQNGAVEVVVRYATPEKSSLED